MRESRTHGRLLRVQLVVVGGAREGRPPAPLRLRATGATLI